MIYADTSVILARLLAEDKSPPDGFWDEFLVSSRLVEYETWTRIHARKLANTHGEHARVILGKISILELSPVILARALEPFPAPVRTLDALHLASMCYIRESDPAVVLATYDTRLASAARAMKFRILSP